MGQNYDMEQDNMGVNRKHIPHTLMRKYRIRNSMNGKDRVLIIFM